MSLEEFTRDVARRREASDVVDVPPNSGQHRTPFKRAMLAALKELGADW